MQKTLTLSFFLSAYFSFSQVPTNGLVAKYSFDGSLTTDNHTGTYTLTNSGATLDNGINSQPNTSVFFDGNDYLSINNSAFRLSSFSIATWFYMTALNSYETFATVRFNAMSAPYNSFNFFTGNNAQSKLSFALTTTNGNNDVTIQDNTVTLTAGHWHHAVATCHYDGTNTTVKLYLNGSLKTTTAVPGQITYNSTGQPFTLGNVIGAGTGNAFHGMLDEFLFYNRALDASEVSAIYSPSVGLPAHVVKNFKAYPNPVSSFLNMETEKATEVRIVNVLGVTVATHHVSEGRNQLDVSQLSEGLYMIQTSEGTTTTFIKE